MIPPDRRLLTKLRCLLVRDQDVEGWASTKVIFFGLGMGRSGTKSLASLLGSATGAHVVHEPVPEDFDAYQRAFRDGREAVRYLRFRKRDIYPRAKRSDARVYGEVNSVLRRHAAALKHAFPDAFRFHLVRDGRDVVRPIYSRGTMSATDTDGIFPALGPPPRRATRTRISDERNSSLPSGGARNLAAEVNSTIGNSPRRGAVERAEAREQRYLPTQLLVIARGAGAVAADQ